MSDTALALFSKDKLPAYLRNAELDETTKALMGGGGGKRISIRGGVFRKIVGGKEVMKNEDRAMNVVIVRSSPSVARTFYEVTYVEGSNMAPTCWSSDGEKPDADVKNPEASACANCPQNIAGSGQGDSRACRFSQRLAIILDGDLEGDVMQLSLPAQSLFGKDDGNGMPLQQYVRFLAGHQVPVTAVVTEMKFDTSSATPKLTFKPVRPLTEDEYGLAKEQGETQDALDAVTFSVLKVDGGEAGTSEDKKALEGAIKEEKAESDDDADDGVKTKKPATRKRRTKAEIEAEKAALAAQDDEDEDEDEDDGDDEEAELLRRLEEARARKSKKGSKKNAEKEDSEPQEPKVRSKSKPKSEAEPQSAADILAAWASDDDDDDDADD